MKAFWIITILAIAIILSLLFSNQYKTAQVIINNYVFNVEVANTEAMRTQGLSGRKSLDDNTGMLFVFEKPDIYPFWMKDTLIPLDIIYINDDKIVEMTTLQPQKGDDIPNYTPQEKAQYVLELNANSGVKVGDEVKIKY